jgi:hypothetical protein
VAYGIADAYRLENDAPQFVQDRQTRVDRVILDVTGGIALKNACAFKTDELFPDRAVLRSDRAGENPCMEACAGMEHEKGQ